MSRVIKFRAWEDFNNKMYKCMVGNTDKMDDDWICPLVWVEERKEWLHSDTCIVMQYTGYKDCEGKEIYEGDILERENCWRARVEFDNGSFMIRIDRVRYNNRVCNVPIGDFGVFEWRVIGNIYENKELLEE